MSRPVTSATDSVVFQIDIDLICDWFAANAIKLNNNKT